MEVVILCGGQGTRIRDVSDDMPKPMIPIGQRPLLWHIMKHYAGHGFTRFVLCLGYKGWLIKRYFLDYPLNEVDFTVQLDRPGQIEIHNATPKEAWQVTMVETGLDAMTGCRLKRIEKYITGNTFHMTYGDGLADVDIAKLVDFHNRHGKIATVTAVRPPGRFGEIEIEGSRAVEFNEKPSTSHGRINGGFFVFDRRIFERLPDDPGLFLERAPLMQLARDGGLMAYLHNGFWQPMDTSREYQYLNNLWNEGKAPWKTWEVPCRRAAA